mgnify:CR=1 FL=1
MPFVISTIGQLEKAGGYIGGSVSVDNRKESFKIVDYLCSLGHRQIAVLTSAEDDESIGKLRLDGYRQALENRGTPLTLHWWYIWSRRSTAIPWPAATV